MPCVAVVGADGQSALGTMLVVGASGGVWVPVPAGRAASCLDKAASVNGRDCDVVVTFFSAALYCRSQRSHRRPSCVDRILLHGDRREL